MTVHKWRELKWRFRGNLYGISIARDSLSRSLSIHLIFLDSTLQLFFVADEGIDFCLVAVGVIVIEHL